MLLLAFQGTSSVEADSWVNVAAGVFIAPFFLFSAVAGQIADKIDKSIVIRRVKLLEVAIMAFGALALFVQSPLLLLVILFFMGLQSAFFGPVKFSILPQHLDDTELVAGNALVEMGTFLAILFGTIAGGLLMDLEVGRLGYVSATVITTAVLGWMAGMKVPKAPPSDPGISVRFNPFTETLGALRFLNESAPFFFPR